MPEKPDAIYMFGDSLSDLGAFYALSGQVLKAPLPPASAGYNGWFSNGLLQSGVAADLLDVPTEVYAVGAARAVGVRTVEQFLVDNGFNTPEVMLPDPSQAALDTDINLGGQVGRFVASGPPAEGAAAGIWIGANDYNNLPSDATPEQVEQTITAVVGSILGAAGALAQAGVERILLYNLPSPDLLPDLVPVPPGAGAIVDLHNAALAGGVAVLASQGIEASIVDMHRIGDEILADARTFGLNPAYLDTPLLLGLGSHPTWIPAQNDWFIPANPALAGVDPSLVAFVDVLHPSSATHGVFGSFVASSIGMKSTFLGPGDNARWLGSEDDFVLGGGGDDLIFSRGGDDTVLAGTGNDAVAGGSGDDIIAGGAGRDHLYGGRGNDVVAGSDGNDLQAGGGRRDLLVDGLGHDLLFSGADRDAFLYSEATRTGGSNATDGGVFFGGSGVDTLYLALEDATRAAVDAELKPGASHQCLASIDVVTHSIERYVFVDPADPAASIVTAARLEEADLWGIV